MIYSETLDYLFSKLPVFSRTGSAAYKADLTNTIALCDSINNPQNNFKTIHIAGTNGKGSTSHMLASILQKAGYKVGLYTSPHLKDFRERIKINGQMCSQEFVVDFVEKIKPTIEQIEPSFFELTVAMAFEYFANEKVDIAVIETGLGGRLDSTNIINPIISVITNIGYDHMNLLGNTLPKIAFEKAGIIKSKTSVVIGEYNDETKDVFIAKANECVSSIYLAQDNYEVINASQKVNILEVSLKRKKEETKTYQLDLCGLYQTKNLITVLETCLQLQQLGLNISEKNIIEGLATTQYSTGLHGRWQTIANNPTIVLDVAHNVDGMKQVVNQLSKTIYQKLHIVLGMVKDKDISSVLKLLPSTANYYFTNANIERAMLANDLQKLASEFDLKGEIFSNVNEAILASKSKASTHDLILVCGSIFLIGEVEYMKN